MDVEIIGPNNINVVHTPQAAAPTVTTYVAFQKAFDHMNDFLFGASAPPCLITLQRKNNALGYFSSNKFVSADGTTKLDEIALNPRFFHTQGPRDIVSTLVHEMVHQLQHHFGKPMRNGYHDRQWAAAMKKIGLQPSHTGKPDGRETGHAMGHYVVEGGQFDLAFRELDATIEWGDVLTQERDKPVKRKRIKFTCLSCGVAHPLVPTAELSCTPCNVPLVPA